MCENYIVVTLDGNENLELECDENGRFMLSSLDALVGVTTSGLKYISHTSRYRGVRVQDGELLPPSDGWQSDTRVYHVIVRWEMCVEENVDVEVAKDVADHDDLDGNKHAAASKHSSKSALTGKI